MMAYLGELADGITTTLMLTLSSFGGGCLGGLVIMLARRSTSRALRWPATAYVEAVRGVPMIVWLFIIYFGLAQGGYLRLDAVPSAILGFTAVSSAYLSEVFRSAVGSLPKGQWEAGAAVGLTPSARFVSVILPQAWRIALPGLTTYLVGLLKDTSVAGIIGATDITFEADQLARTTSDAFAVFLIAGVLYVALGLPAALGARWLESRFTRKLTSGARARRRLSQI